MAGSGLERAGSAAHAAHHGRASGDEDLLGAGRHHVREFGFYSFHAALHAEPVVPVAEVAVGLRKHLLGGDNVIRRAQRHEAHVGGVQSGSHVG